MGHADVVEAASHVGPINRAVRFDDDVVWSVELGALVIRRNGGDGIIIEVKPPHRARAPPTQSSRPSWSKVRPSAIRPGGNDLHAVSRLQVRTLSPMISTKNSSLVRLFHAGPCRHETGNDLVEWRQAIRLQPLKLRLRHVDVKHARLLPAGPRLAPPSPSRPPPRRSPPASAGSTPCQTPRGTRRASSPQPDTAERFRDRAEIGVQEAVDLAPIRPSFPP